MSRQAKNSHGRIDNGDGGNAGTGSATGSTDNGSRSYSDIGSANGDGTAAIGASGKDDEYGDSNFVAPSERSGTKRARRSRGPRHRSGTGSAGAGGSDSGTNSRTEKSGTAEEGAPSDSSASPREVAYQSLGRNSGPTKKESAITLQFVKEGWSIAFSALASALKDPEWNLPDDDASELAERTRAWVSTLDAKRYATLEKRLAKWAPLLSLLMAIVAIVGPRIHHTRTLRRAINLPKKGNATETATVAEPSAARPVVQPNGPVAGNGGAGQYRPNNAKPREASFTRAGFQELFAETDA